MPPAHAAVAGAFAPARLQRGPAGSLRSGMASPRRQMLAAAKCLRVPSRPHPAQCLRVRPARILCRPPSAASTAASGGRGKGHPGGRPGGWMERVAVRVAAAAAQDDGATRDAGETDPIMLERKGIVCIAGEVLATGTSGEGKGSHVAFVAGPDGDRLVPVRTREVRGAFRRVADTLIGLLLPQGGEASVGADYWSFSAWYFIRNVASHASAVLSTQSLLRAVGVGATTAAATSATVNWVLKDGLGRVGCIAAAAAAGNRFDNDPKTFFLAGDLLYEAGIGIEIITPLFPQYFLAIASVANAAKSISYMMRLPPRAAILQTFALRQNVGDISAKANSQEVTASLLGIGMGIGLSALVGTSLPLAFLAFAATSMLVALSSYNALRRVRLSTLNWQRVEIILDSFVREGRVPTPTEVNELERVPSWPPAAPPEGVDTWRVAYGARLDRTAGTVAGLRELMGLYGREAYLLSFEPAGGGRTGGVVNVSVSGEAGAPDALKCLLQAARVKELVRCARVVGDGDGSTGAAGGVAEGLVADSYEWATREVLRLQQGLAAGGWNHGVVLFRPQHTSEWNFESEEDSCPLPGWGGSGTDEPLLAGEAMPPDDEGGLDFGGPAGVAAATKASAQ